MALAAFSMIVMVGVKDVLSEIIQYGGLVPQNDFLDYTNPVTQTLSLSPSRTYASLYAQFHYEKGETLRTPQATGLGVFILRFTHCRRRRSTR